jgi:hypothetical protein
VAYRAWVTCLKKMLEAGSDKPRKTGRRKWVIRVVEVRLWIWRYKDII